MAAARAAKDSSSAESSRTRFMRILLKSGCFFRSTSSPHAGPFQLKDSAFAPSFKSSASLAPYAQARSEPLRANAMVASTSLPSFQGMSTSKPPRARRPVTLPVGQAEGSAGSSSMLAVHELLHEHFGDAGGAAEVAVDLERRMSVEEIRRGAASGRTEQRIEEPCRSCSPSCRRAQRLRRQPRPQPVASSPRISREP